MIIIRGSIRLGDDDLDVYAMRGLEGVVDRNPRPSRSTRLRSTRLHDVWKKVVQLCAFRATLFQVLVNPR